MSKDVLNGSRNETFEKAKERVAKLSQNAKVNYAVPTVLEALVSINTYNLKSESMESLFIYSPDTSTYCSNLPKSIFGYECRSNMTVGTFHKSDGCSIGCTDFSSIDIGVAVLWKFRPFAIG